MALINKADAAVDPHVIVSQRTGCMEGGWLLVNEYADGTVTAQWRAHDWEQWSHPETRLERVPLAEGVVA